MPTPLTASTEFLEVPTIRAASMDAEACTPPEPTDLASAEPYALIVEADVEVAATVARVLVAQGLAPVVVGDALAALAALAARGTPCLTVINPSLEGVDGFAVLRALRGRASVTAAPAVALTAVAALRIRAIELNRELGICAVLSPTLPLPRLAEVLGEVLVRARAEAVREPVRPAPAPPAAPSAGRTTVSARRLEARITEQVRRQIVDDAPTSRGVDRTEGWREFVLRMG